MLIQILLHTPKWVYALFATLVWLGARQLVAGRMGLTRVTLMPVAMTGLSVYGVGSAFGDSPLALLAWAAGLAAALAIVLQRRVPAATRFDAGTRQFQLAGSAVPLALMMGIFFTKYAIGVLLVMHPGLAHHGDLALGASALYGVFSGIFTGRAMRLWRLARRAGRDTATASPAVRA